MTIFNQNSLDSVIHMAHSNTSYRQEAITELEKRKAEFILVAGKYKAAYNQHRHPEISRQIKKYEN